MWNLSVIKNMPDDTEETWTADYDNLKNMLEDIATLIKTEPGATSFVFTVVPEA